MSRTIHLGWLLSIAHLCIRHTVAEFLGRPERVLDRPHHSEQIDGTANPFIPRSTLFLILNRAYCISLLAYFAVK